MVVVDIHIFEGFHFKRVEIDVQGKQVKGEIPDVNKIIQVVSFKELFADDGAFGPKTRVISLVSLVSIHLDELFESE